MSNWTMVKWMVELFLFVAVLNNIWIAYEHSGTPEGVTLAFVTMWFCIWRHYRRVSDALL